MKESNDTIKAALKRYLNYLIDYGEEAVGTGVIILDAEEAGINHQILEVINQEQRCQFLSLVEFARQEKHKIRTVLLLDSHQQVPAWLGGGLEGVFRASSFERGAE